MIKVQPLCIGDDLFIAIEVNLPKTNLLVIRCETGYVMCGALDVALLRENLASRGIIAARAVGVKTMEDLLEGTVESCTQKAEELGIHEGMAIREALILMKRADR